MREGAIVAERIAAQTDEAELVLLASGAARAQPAVMADGGGPMRLQARRALALREAGVYYALILIILALAAVCAALGRPSYLSAVNLINILYQASPVALWVLR